MDCNERKELTDQEEIIEMCPLCYDELGNKQAEAGLMGVIPAQAAVVDDTADPKISETLYTMDSPSSS